MGYPTDLLTTRSIVKHGKYAVITPFGLVNNVIPGFENCDISILGSPRLGAKFVDYIVTMHQGGGNRQGFGYEGVETFVYCLEGKIKAGTKDQSFELKEGGYLYCPPGEKMYLENAADGDSRCFLYKQKYTPLEGHQPHLVTGNANENPGYDYEDMENVNLKDLLPTDDLGFDMNFHILTFDPGASHSIIETHFQEHGAYLLSGQGMYNLDNEWVPVKKGDYIYMGPYCLQACYAVGREKMSYVYSKDCNRDPEL